MCVACVPFLFASKTLASQMHLTYIVRVKIVKCTNYFFRCKSTKAEGRGKARKRKDSEESRAAAPFGFHVVLPDMRGRVRGNGSTSINSFYITSLC